MKDFCPYYHLLKIFVPFLLLVFEKITNRMDLHYDVFLSGSEKSVVSTMDDSLRNIIEDNDLDFISLEILGQIGSGNWNFLLLWPWV